MRAKIEKPRRKKKERFQIFLPDAHIEALKRVAHAQYETPSHFIKLLLDKYFRDNNVKVMPNYPLRNEDGSYFDPEIDGWDYDRKVPS